MSWSDEKIEGIVRVDRVVAVFQVHPDERIPLYRFDVKILERSDGSFLGIPNVAIKNPVTRYPEGTSGLGDTIEEALRDAIRYFFLEVEQNRYDRPLTEDDFEWSCPEDF